MNIQKYSSRLVFGILLISSVSSFTNPIEDFTRHAAGNAGRNFGRYVGDMLGNGFRDLIHGREKQVLCIALAGIACYYVYKYYNKKSNPEHHTHNNYRVQRRHSRHRHC